MAANRVYSTLGSSMITVAMRWTDRLIGIASTVILARLLLPEDFGIVAMAALFVGFADVFLNFGVHVPLIRDPDATEAHYHSAWTLRLLQCGASAIVLVVAAPWVAVYFEDARVELVVKVLACSMILLGLENIGTIDFQKKMQFGAEFKLLFTKRLVGFVSVVAAALALRSYWALVIGTLARQSTGLTLSYVMHPMRPRPSFAKMREILGISQWMLVSNIGTYLKDYLHRTLVGRWSSADIMGAYTLADEISSMPSSEVLAPINRALFPAFAKVRHDLRAFKEKVLLAQGVQTLIAVPAAVGLAVVAEDAVLVVLGETWRGAVPFVQILALVNITQALTASGNYALIVLGNVRASALFTWIQVAVFALLAFTFFLGSDAESIAWLRLGVTLAGLVLLLLLVLRAFPTLRGREILAAIWRPFTAAGLMAAVLIVLRLPGLPPALALGVEIVLGAIVYPVACWTLWRLSGRPGGGEAYIVGVIAERLRRRG